jgi:hypothetical protein
MATGGGCSPVRRIYGGWELSARALTWEGEKERGELETELHKLFLCEAGNETQAFIPVRPGLHH